MLRFYDFPAAPIESTFATVRTLGDPGPGPGSLSVDAPSAGTRRRGLVMAYKLLDAAQDRWRKVPNLSPS